MFDIDSGIFIGFLIITLALGLVSGRGIKNIKEYAVGNRNFSTATVSATIVATWVGGDFFYVTIAESYTNGLHHIWVALLGDFLALLFVGLFFAPRMGEFLGSLSIAEAMGNLFGKKVQVITSIAGFIGASGAIAIELKLSGLIFSYALGVSNFYGVIISGFIVTLYSSLGGIKSVTFTDVIQFFTFGVVIPVIAYVLLNSISDIEVVTNTISNNPLFDYKQVFNFSNPLALKQFFVFLFFIVPPFGPAIFQRVAMAKDTIQVRRSFIIASITCLLFAIIIAWIAILILSIDTSNDPNEAIKSVIFNSSYTGLKGLMLAGIMAMIMSTVDSYINSTSVLITHDFLKPLNLNFAKSELFSARVISLVIGLFSLMLSLRDSSLLELIITTCSFYMTIVTVPFIMAVFGFRSSEKSVMLGMLAGVVTVLLWDYVIQVKTVNSVTPGMLANLITLVSSHYILKQKGGWVGIKDDADLIRSRLERRRNLKKLLLALKSFNFITACKNNCPKGEGLISILGLFVMISVFSSTQTLQKEYQAQYNQLISILYPMTLCSSSILIAYPLWLESWKNSKLIGLFWNLIMFFVLVCFSFLMVLISDFSEIQLTVFMVNIIVISSVNRWHWSLFNILFGVSITAFLYQSYYPNSYLGFNFASSQFKIIYLLMLVSSSLIIFLKPKQELYEITEQKAEHLNELRNTQEEYTKKALALKSEFIRNINHEYHAPMTGIFSMAQILQESYHKFSEKQRLLAIDTIVKSSARLEAFDSNISSLAELAKTNYRLKLEPINLSSLLEDRINFCRKIYEDNKEDRQFILDFKDAVEVSGDKFYLTQTLDNLIINAITLNEDKNKVSFVITDEGIGIPTEELKEIFGEFTVSSKTRTFAGNRGIGLALCKSVIEAHGGIIKAESTGERGASFSFDLPRK